MKVLKSTIITAIFAMGSVLTFAQATEADAINAYNEAQELASAKSYDAAISKYKEAIDLADQVGNTDIKDRSNGVIPKLYYQKAASSFNAFRSSPSVSTLDVAIADFEVSYEKGQEYGDSEIEQRSIRIIAQLHYQKGTMMLKQENYEAADAEFDRAIEINANYAKAFYQKGLVHKNLDEGTVEAFLQWFDRAIVLGEAQNDGEVVRLSKDAAHAELLYRGAKLIQDGKYSAAIELLRASLEYNLESADSYYRLAEASNKLERYDDAIKNGNLAITYEQGGSTDKAKIYFEIGLAYQMKGEKAKACEAFSSATYGSFRAPSEHKMEFELKCESTDPSN